MGYNTRTEYYAYVCRNVLGQKSLIICNNSEHYKQVNLIPLEINNMNVNYSRNLNGNLIRRHFQKALYISMIFVSLGYLTLRFLCMCNYHKARKFIKEGLGDI